jgi:hypothetical protein
MASTYQRSQNRPFQPAGDFFIDQLDDVKGRLSQMQYSLNHLTQNPPHLHLPSGPQFWQLFTSLQTEVHGLRTVITGLECNVLDLEEKLSSRLTPSSSDAESVELQHASLSERETPSNEVESNSSTKAGEGVAFRDREITQLEELVMTTQNNLKQSEELVHEKSGEIQQLERRVSNHEALLSEKQFDIDRLYAECKSKDAALQMWAGKQHSYAQSYLRKKTELCNADRRVQQLQHALYEVDDIVANKDEEIRRLREFCESKDMVVHQQEQIIARGATLMEERDDEIGRLTRKLKTMTDDYENEVRQHDRVARLLEERDEVKKPRSSTEESERKEKMVPLPFNIPSEEAFTRTRGQWTPQEINGGSVRTFYEQQRALSWQGGKAREQYKFGLPGHASSRQHDEERDVRRSNSLMLLERLARENATQQPPSRLTGSRQMTVPLDRTPLTIPLDRTPLTIPLDRPPLPAPLPASPFQSGRWRTDRDEVLQAYVEESLEGDEK